MPGSQMAFTETQDEEDIVTLPMQTVDGDEIEVGKYDKISACTASCNSWPFACKLLLTDFS